MTACLTRPARLSHVSHVSHLLVHNIGQTGRSPADILRYQEPKGSRD